MGRVGAEMAQSTVVPAPTMTTPGWFPLMLCHVWRESVLVWVLYEAHSLGRLIGRP